MRPEGAWLSALLILAGVTQAAGARLPQCGSLLRGPALAGPYSFLTQTMAEHSKVIASEQTWSLFFLLTSPRERSYSPHFPDEETEIQKQEVTQVQLRSGHSRDHFLLS